MGRRCRMGRSVSDSVRVLDVWLWIWIWIFTSWFAWVRVGLGENEQLSVKWDGYWRLDCDVNAIADVF